MLTPLYNSSVHNEVTHRASELLAGGFGNNVTAEYIQYITNSPSYVQAGSYFPDWGYQCLGYGQSSEDAHWPPFVRAAIAYIHDEYPEPWGDRETEVTGLIAFVFAIASHDIADVFWHGLGGFQESFIHAMAKQNFHGNTAKAHTAADAGAEFTLRHSAELQYFNSTWTVPARDLANIYFRMYTKLDGTPPSEADLVYCMRVGYAAFKADLRMGKYLFPHYGQQSPFLIENLNHYHRGGLQDMSLQVAKCWREVAMTFTDQSHTDTMCSPHWDSSRMTNIRNYKSLAATQSYEESLLILRQSGYNVMETWEESSGVVTLSVMQAESGSTPQQQVLGLDISLSQDQDLQSEECKEFEPDMTLTLGHMSGSLGYDMVLGDFNDDGFPDIAVSDPYYSEVDLHAGIVMIIDGRKHTHQLDNHSVFRASTMQLYNNVQESRFGWSMVVLDFNDDGIDDLVVSSPFDNQEQGSVNIYYGHADRGLSKEPDVVLQLSRQRGTYGFGTRLYALDIDGDGRKDLVVGCSHCGLPQAAQTGAMMVYLSSNNPPKHISSPNFSIRSPIIQGYEHFGSSAAMIEGRDGKRLLIAGSPGYSWSKAQRVGRVYAFSIDNMLKPRLQWTMNGNSEFQQFGSEIVTSGDNVIISSWSDDTSGFGRNNRWQAGSVGIYKASELIILHGQRNDDSGLSEKLYGKEMAGHFGTSFALEKGQLWIGEPLAQSEQGRVHIRNITSASDKLECIYLPNPRSRFGHRVAVNGKSKDNTIDQNA
ncbi:hypothetical protein INT43_008604 [Umbelopsis isabellina]|uniref:Phosphatidylinositol-glycan-specific phospholipase D n=1 Tax=Mortierella isabellina TaxID=91625 RepID=A0A8H7PVF1_MORIS|nr:hypothetical protein INT43_008604 [Umbelopsis isabellina]